MTRCDHGIRLDRYCADCESGLAAFIADNEVRYARENRRRSRQWVPLIVAAGVVLFALVRLSR